MRVVVLGSLLLALAIPAGASAATPPWQAAADVRDPLADAGKTLVLDGPDPASARVDAAASAARAELDGLLAGPAPEARAALDDALAGAATAARADDTVGLEVARAAAGTAILRGAAAIAIDAAARGDVATARDWLLVREFRPPTRFSRPGADATLALRALDAGSLTPAAAAAAVRTDLLDTYQGLLRDELDAVAASDAAGLTVRRAQAAAEAAGLWGIVAGAFAEQRGAAQRASADATFAALAGAARTGGAGLAAPLAAAHELLASFRAAPLVDEDAQRRAAQVRRFVKLVPVEYGRAIADGQVKLDFELQEAITFRDGAAAAFGDLEPLLLARDPAGTRELGERLARLGDDLATAARHGAVADPKDVAAAAAAIEDLTERSFPEAWKSGDGSADFDVIGATLDRLEAAVSAHDHARAEAARLEAYAIFEFGPEQRLRGLAPGLFQKVEGYFWYGNGGHEGLVQLIKRRADPADVHATRVALDAALLDAEQAIGAGPRSRTAIVANTAVIVFREGLEAVLILAVLTAGMVGAQRRLRRPMYFGAAAALAASAVTWAAAQTLLRSLNHYGEKLEAVVSVVAIAVLLLILNWFFHKVYWVEHLQGLHARKRRVLGGRAGAVLAAPFVGLVLLGFTSVYREGFETVLFLQALVVEAGTPIVLAGVLAGLAATAVVGFVTFTLQQRLPYKRMLVLTGVLVAWVLVVMVGTTVQVMQSVGWLPVTPIDGLTVPYWTGLWFGLYPTWEGIVAQVLAAVFVLGSYVAAEALARRRRRAIMAGEPTPPGAELAPAPAPLAETSR